MPAYFPPASSCCPSSIHDSPPNSTSSPGMMQTHSIDRQRRVSCGERQSWHRSRRHITWAGRLASQLLVASTVVTHTSAALISNWQNCLASNIINSNPTLLQWVPTYVDATFLPGEAGGHMLNLTLYGNVKGQAVTGDYPPPDSPDWSDPSVNFGKIVNVSADTSVYTTLYQDYEVLTYSAYNAPNSQFCEATVGVACPISPNFNPNVSDPLSYPAFTVGHLFGSSYSFATIIANARVKSGNNGALDIACVTADITPALGGTLSGLLRFLPVAVLLVVAIANITASMFSPWGSMNFFRWTSNYGRDPDLLRLVTPGFGDCIQYIQFIVLTGSLSLAYPGYFQPVTREASWSALMFNTSLVSHGTGIQNPRDGIYVVNGTYGLTRMSQLVGMSSYTDIWASTVAWVLVLIAVTLIVCQVGFLMRFVRRKMSHSPPEDLRSKNWPFTGGSLVRIVCNFFLLPIVALSFFQLVIARHSPVLVVALAAILLGFIVLFVVWILRLIIVTKPRSQLFDELSIVMLYGPLYNTYSDDAAPFALIPTFLTFVRGIAIGAVQPSGIAQIVMLAICEVILILTLHAFRPFQSPTSMNAYHTFFACARLLVVLLCVAFAPSLGVDEGPKGWIGYGILLLHAIVLVFGFLLNALQTIIEVCARLAGAGGEEGTGAAARGGLVKILGVRQLSRRKKHASYRNSRTSSSAILVDDNEAKSLANVGRSRSISASSRMMLHSQHASDVRASHHLDRTISANSVGGAAMEGYSYIHGNGGPASDRPVLNIKTEGEADPYYRPPRARRATTELVTPGAKSRDSGSGDWANFATSPDHGPYASGSPGQINPAAAYMRARDGSDPALNQPRSSVDYAVREVDLYYGMRGPALSSQPGRKLKTGPADPVGPVSNATGWFKGMFGGKKKDSGKGFEVVRSSRAQPRFQEDEDPKLAHDPYDDSPVGVGQAEALPYGRTRSNMASPEPTASKDRIPIDLVEDDDGAAVGVQERPPSIAPLDALGGGLGLPSRWSSRVSRSFSGKKEMTNSVPLVAQKTSRRGPSQESASPPPIEHLSTSRVGTGRGHIRNVSSGVHRGGFQFPFNSPSQDEARRPSEGAESLLSIDDDTHGAAESSALGAPISPMTSGTNYGHVQQHRASDSLHLPQPHAHTGQAAEMFETSPRRSAERGGMR